MGIYLNPGNASFLKAIRSKIYVDKTELIRYTNDSLGTKQGNICVSRPRRFGKSVTVDMLAAYYSCGCESYELFSNFKIAGAASFHGHLNRHNVIFLNIQRFFSRAGGSQNLVSYLEKTVLKELRSIYSTEIDPEEKHLSAALEQIYNSTGKGFVFLIDEWDCMFREKQHDTENQTRYLDFLRDLLKDQLYVDLAYMTGILPIKKYGTHSALNMFDECSMTEPDRLAEFVGFTENEVEGLCEEYSVDFQEMKRWYDGYLLDEQLHIYNPKSVVDALLRKKFSNYWTGTETYEALKVYIDMNFDGLRNAVVTMLGSGRCRINPRTFQNDMTSFRSKDDVLTLLVHLGYLSYDENRQEVFIPNQEVMSEFENAVQGGGWEEIADILRLSEKVLQATIEGDAQTVEKSLDIVHMENTSILSYNDENSLSCVITIAYFCARKEYTLIRELPAGKGYADIAFIPRKHADVPALLVELKWDKSVKGAIAQIKDKKYMGVLKEYADRLLLVGINYDKKSKRHQCMIERH